MKISIKPLSVNKCWQGRRFKTIDYKHYERECLLKLRPLKVPGGKLGLIICFGVSSKNMDIDNGLKPFIDILQKKYGFNDSSIYMLTVAKDIVKKGDEYVEFRIEALK